MCTRPMAALPIGRTENGKTKYKIIPYTRAFGLDKPDNDYSQIVVNRGSMILIHCGKCTECKMSYAKQWSDRCMLELQQHESSYFLTLTYDDDHIKKNDKGYPTLDYSHFQGFMKRLREAIEPKKCRFFMSGEYGSRTKRPHYHAIIFGLELNDLEFYGKSGANCNIYTSKFINDKWQLGQVLIGDVTPQSCAYVARYVTKKQGSCKADYEKLDILPEFTHMSLKPGIGKDVYSPEIFRKGYLCLSTENGGIRVYPPKYYEPLFEAEFPDEYEELKRHRTQVLETQAIEFTNESSKTYYEHLDDKDIVNAEKSSSFVRNQI